MCIIASPYIYIYIYIDIHMYIHVLIYLFMFIYLYVLYRCILLIIPIYGPARLLDRYYKVSIITITHY